jgi:hypothetical protein
MDTFARRPKAPRILPLGYKYILGEEGGEIIVDEEVAQNIRIGFALAAFGKASLRDIAAGLADRGVTGRRGEPLGATGLWKTLTDPFLAGFIEVEGSLVPSGYPAIVDWRIFEDAQVALRRRQRNPGRTESSAVRFV